jgi:hypothetical protein
LGKTPLQLFGSLKNLARRMLEAFRYFALSDQAFDPVAAAAFKSASIVPSPDRAFVGSPGSSR